MKIKTSELIGPALDWTVAKCEGFKPTWYEANEDWLFASDAPECKCGETVEVMLLREER